MTIAWNAFTPGYSRVGGLSIGSTEAPAALGNGRVAGIASIVASPLRALSAECSVTPERTRLALVGGLLLAGMGIGKGCTSGHGVCGLSCFPLRSLLIKRS